MGCCNSEAVAGQVVTAPPPPPPEEPANAKDTTSIVTESSMKSEQSHEDFFQGPNDEKDKDLTTRSSTIEMPSFSHNSTISAPNSLDNEGTERLPWATSTAVDKPGTAPPKMSQIPAVSPSFSKFTSGIGRPTTATSKKSSISPTADDVTVDTDDEVITVFSEGTRVDSLQKKVRSVKVLPTLDDVSLPEEAYVMLPDVKQRGYEPWGIADYSDIELTSQEPYEVGSLVWFRREGASKFKWYIPGRIKNYVFNGDDNEVTGYEIDVDCDDEVMKKSDGEIVDILKNAPPVDTMLRWDEQVPPCPIPGIEGTSESSQSRINKARESYGDDFGFEGATQNGIGYVK